MKEGIRLLLLFSIVSVALCQWVNQTQYGTLPLQRTDASFVYSATQNKFYLFGGRGTTGLFNTYVALNDMFSFTLETTTWAKITTSGASVSVRWGQSTVLSPDQNSFYIFGGKVDETSNVFYNQTYKYDIVANTWSLINAGTVVPPSRAQHSAVLTAKNTMFIFGGEVYNTTQKFRNDLWKLDLNTNTWTMIQDQGPLSPPPPNRPTPRLGHAVALTSSNIMLVYGGMDYTGLALNQIWAYDLTSGSWSNLTPGSSPSARTTPGSAFSFLNNLYIFGGAGSSVFNDFWTYAVSNVWASMNNTTPPSVRISSQMAINSISNTLVLYGGRTTSGWFNEVYTYPVSSFAPIQLYYSVDKTGPTTYVYTFKLVQEASYSGDVDKIVFADAGTGAPANTNPMSLVTPTSVQSPSGFTSLITISESGHNGWGYYNGAAAGWTPSGVGSSLTWKIQASNFIPHGRMFWSNLDGTGTHANYLLAIYDCREVLAGSLDVDGDGYSPCDYYDPKYFDCNDNMAAVNPAAAENCNGYDDNCNGVIDTDVLIFPHLDLQSGVCLGYNKTCQSGSWVSNYTLVVPLYEPVEVSCDGNDNDCDTLTDESLTPPAANLTQGVCAGATKVCGGSAGWLEPNYTAIPNYQNPEVSCDLLDNNCDGIMNNIVALPNATNQLGACKGAKQMCLANGTWVDNFATQVNYSVPEGNKCDSVDNDCDGIVDNNLTLPPGSKNTGVCAGYTMTCVAGVWVDFNYTTLVAYQANETKCNNLDDDCDGLVDEYLTGNLTTNQNGVCSGTKQICQAGTWVNNYTVNPLYEFNETKCNNLDDDCDGFVDNNLPVKNATKTLGVCAGANQTCVNGAWVDANYTAIPYYQVSETLCDTYDNDCDGNTDSFPANLTTRQGGPCFGMFQKCVNGTGQDDYSSIPYFQYNETLCDGLDNDCDGKNDTFRGTTNTTKQLGVCAGAYKTCKNATWVDDYSYIPGYEPVEQTCDGLDNDCDGQVDEGLTPPLSSNQAGVCLGSRKFCSNTTHNWVDPIWTTIPYYEVIEATCDSKDNDCDNSTDENLWYVSDNQVGVCEGTQKVCQGGIYSNRFQFYPNGSSTHYEVNEQSCDGLDNDCDGSIDENLSQLATNQNGVCAGSMKTCAGTAGWQEPDPTTIPGYLPEEVYCDGLDNDCDSRIDNTVSGGCPSNTSSSSGGGESSRGDPVVPGMDFYSNENYNVMGVSMNGTQVVILIFAILGIGVTCLVSCGWAFFSKKKKRPRRAPFPYGVGPDGMPLPPGLMGEEPEIPMDDYSPTPTGSMPDGTFSSRGNVSRGSTNPSLPIIGRQYG